ncbi:MAG: T9SS type A sorting domain-containing protein, partial [Bacteroidales bacterium]
YMELQEERKLKNTSAEEAVFECVPSPLQLNFGSLKTRKSTTELPSLYDLRELGFVTPVKSQLPAGTCWSFCALAGVESNWLVTGRGTYDLSEQNMVNCNGFGFFQGGTGHIASAYLTRFSGPVLESDDPYEPNITTCNTTEFSLPQYVLSSRFLPIDQNLIKETVMKYGGVCSEMEWDNSYYNSNDFTYYYSGDNPWQNHAILVVGWDDNKVVTGGASSPKGTKGAWIIKNSWGSSWGDDGYAYISYADSSMFVPVYHFDQTVDTSKIEKINMYDENGATKAYGFRSEYAWGLSRFMASEDEIIFKVGTFIVSAGTEIDIEIYQIFTNDSLQNLIYSKKNIYCDYPGVRVFDVAAKVTGDYYVKVKYYSPGYLSPIPVEASIYGYATADIMPQGHQWISNDGMNWTSIGQGQENKLMNLTIRTYTAPNNRPFASFDLDKKQLCFGDSIKPEANLPDSSAKYSWKFLPDGISIADTGIAPGWVKFSTSGIKFITLAVENETGIDSITREIEVVSSMDISIIPSLPDALYVFAYDFKPSSYRCPVDKLIALTAFSDADSFVWKLPVDTAYGKTIFVTPSTIGINQYTVAGFQGSCKGEDTVEVIGYSRPVNDDVCNAIELQLNQNNGPFSNVNAGNEYGEPMPPTGWCTTPGLWCKWAIPKNTVWFRFTIPDANSSYNFISSGFDTKMAIYKAKTCDSILLGNYKLIAAKDDQNNGWAAEIRSLKGLSVGEKYWLQFDGEDINGRVSKGTFYIDFNIQSVGINNSHISNNIEIFPNPSDDIINIEIENPDNATIEIYNVSGKLVLSKKLNSKVEKIDISGFPRGIYIVKVMQDSTVYYEKVMVR